ncbi:MAG: hypothetical protein JNK75_11860 [Betaproteobacteria bacterium]|nr:hypothetical protein [Betaproteobacteria bacterium]
MDAHHSPHPILRPLVAALMMAATLSGCAAIRDCGDVLGDKENPRIRSSAMRMHLHDLDAAYARFAPYAAMAAVVYHEAPECKHGVGKPDGLPAVPHHAEILEFLGNAGWHIDTEAPGQPACDDELGMFFRVFKKAHPTHDEVVVAFRGTKSQAKDWVAGNLVWLTRFFTRDDQYAASARLMRPILDHYALRPAKASNQPASQRREVQFNATGHSLGGGLAQNVFYRYPTSFKQAYAFDPSPVTGYSMGNDAANRAPSCACDPNGPDGEARIYRIYETDEVLAWVRWPLKLVVPINRHIQEVRLNFDVGHSMAGMAKAMIDKSAGKPLGAGTKWWRQRDHATNLQSCSRQFEGALEASCKREGVCPP